VLVAVTVFFVRFFRMACIKQGLAEAHYRCPAARVQLLRRNGPRILDSGLSIFCTHNHAASATRFLQNTLERVCEPTGVERQGTTLVLAIRPWAVKMFENYRPTDGGT